MTTIKRVAGLALALLLGSVATTLAQETRPPQDGLNLHDEGDVLTIQFGGRAAPIGIPSWKVVLRQNDAGNISSLHVPADDPAPLAARGGVWPLAVVATRNDAGISGTMSKGRENYVNFPAETFRVAEKSPEKIVVDVGGPSKNRHFVHQRTYTFTPAGVKIEGSVHALIDLHSVVVALHWERLKIAGSHVAALPIRQQGNPSWGYMTGTGSDADQLLPKFVHYPLEAELRLNQPTPTFIRIFFDRNFESAEGQRRVVHNNKDVHYGVRPIFKKLFCMPAGPIANDTKQSYEIRLQFESHD